MKKLLYLGIVLMFVSCGANESESTASNESESTASNESESSANESESTTPTANADGKETSTIKIGDLEVMTEDAVLEHNDWNSAVEGLEAIGDGWRLPTKDELNILYQNKDKIGGFEVEPGWNYYWSSKEEYADWALDGLAWYQEFGSGEQKSVSKLDGCNVRAVRSIE